MKDTRPGFTEFVMTSSGGLYRTALLLTRDPHAAHDLLQDSLLAAWRSWDRITGQPEAYVRTVLTRQYLTGRRRRWTGEIPTEQLPERGRRAGDQPDETGLVDARLSLAEAIGALPPQQRAVVVLRYFHDLTEADTARTLGVTVGTVKSHHARALAALRISDLLTDGQPVGAGEER